MPRRCQGRHDVSFLSSGMIRSVRPSVARIRELNYGQCNCEKSDPFSGSDNIGPYRVDMRNHGPQTRGTKASNYWSRGRITYIAEGDDCLRTAPAVACTV